MTAIDQQMNASERPNSVKQDKCFGRIRIEYPNRKQVKQHH